MKKNRTYGLMDKIGLLKMIKIMRFTIFILFLSLSQTFAVNSYSQQTKLSLDMRNARVEDVLDRIEKNSEFFFMYNKGMVNVDRKIDIQVEEKNVNEVLNKIFANTDISYSIKNRQILLINSSMTDSGNESATQQQKSIFGKVTDSSGGPLPGVSLIVKGTTTGVITDMDGKFTLSNVPENAILQFSFVGMKTQEVLVFGKSTINIVMQEENIGIEEVVAVGYGTQKRESVTGAISSVKTDQLISSSETSVASALVGKLGGVSARQSTGKPGAAADIQIRNLGNPLYVIDGIQKDGGQFNNIDANDIESITVLKDASAAIYGIQASNGVIVVNTKKGKRNSPNQINVNYRKGWQNFTQYPEMMNSAQWVDHMVERDMNLYGATSWTREEYNKWQQGTDPKYQSFNWRKFIIKPNSPQSYLHMDASGGNDKINYYLSYSSLDQSGMFDGFKFKRNNFQSNIQAELAHGLNIGMDINGRIENNDGVMTTVSRDHYYIYSEAIFRNRPTERPYANDNPDYPADNGNRTYVNTSVINKKNSGSWVDTWRVLQGNLSLTYNTPIKGLTAKLLGSYYFAGNDYDGQKFDTKAYTFNKETNEYVVTGGNANRSKLRKFNSVTENMFRAQINYLREEGDHQINAVVAAEMSERKMPNFTLNGIPTTNYLTLLKTSEFNTLGNTYEENARAGIIGRVNYTYKNKYIVELSGRYDGSYKFLPENRWGLFPAVSLGYRISQEQFWTNSILNRIFNDFKIRSSYGKLGDDTNVGGFDYFDGYNFDKGKYVMGDNQTIGIEQRGLPSTNISWITTSNFNIGIDASMLNQKLYFSGDFFTRKRDGLLALKNDIVIPSEVGFNPPLANLESDMNIGWDASIDYRDKLGELKYSLGVNMGFSRRKTLVKYNPKFSTSYDYWKNNQENRWQGIMWGYYSDGQFTTQEEIDNYPIDNDGKGNRDMRPGDIKYQDLNGDGILNSQDMRAIAYQSGLPLLNYGINLNLSWKGFDLYMLWQGAGMYNYNMEWELIKPAPGDGNSTAFLADRWHREDTFDLNSKWIPGKYPSTGSWISGRNNNYDRRSDFWLYNINYIRLKNIELGYNISKSYSKLIGLETIRLYVNGTNLVTFDNIDVVDPELGNTNGVGYPQVKTINVGCKVTF